MSAATTIEIGTTGSSRQSFDTFNPRPLLEKLMRNTNESLDLTTTREAILKQFVEERVLGATFEDEEQREYLLSIIRYWFHNNYNSLLTLIMGRTRVYTDTERNALYEEQLAKAKRAIKVNWFNYLMPNGKKLSECTGRELKAMRQVLDENLRRLIDRVVDGQAVKTAFTKDELQRFLS